MRMTCEEFCQLGDEGAFEGRQAMLIDGTIIEQGWMNPPHAIAIGLISDELRSAFGNGWLVRTQMPLILDEWTNPMPDGKVVVGNPRDYTEHPTTARLVVEIADTTLAFDCGEKASIYAKSGIADYWVLDLENRQLLVFRDPQPDPAQLHGYAYQQQLTFGPADSIAPLAAPTAPIKVADLLP